MRSVLWTVVLPVVLAACGGDDDEGCIGDCACVGAECVCPGSGDCVLLCSASCDLQCAGSGDCEFECGADCRAECTGSGACELHVGPSSVVECTGSGGCLVDCHGDCSVSCPGQGECLVACDAGAVCDLGDCESPLECPDGLLVCNGACPE